MNELTYTSAKALAQAIRNKEVSSEEVVKAHLERIEGVNPRLNAVVLLTAESALDQARGADAALACGEIKGPLHGVPVTIKDNIETAGVISTSGTKGRSSFAPAQDATVAARMWAAGAIMLGKTNLPEFGLAYETDNLVYGRTNNPYDLSRTPGGSSGGEGAIIASGGSPLGLGNDMGGSIRLPSHFCGIAGIKPTTDRVPRTGHFPPALGALDPLWQAGPIARYVEDLILTLSIIAGVDWRDPAVVPMPLGDPEKVDLRKLRVALHTDNGIASPTPETAEVVRKAAKALSDAGMEVEEALPRGIEQTYEIFFGLIAADGGAGIQMVLQMVGTTEVHPYLQAILDLASANAMTTPEFGGLIVKWGMFKAAMISFMQKYDVIICPACAYPAMPHGRTGEDFLAFSYTMTYNLTGWPGVVVRGGTSPEGLPIGVQIVARPWREDVALAAGKYIEAALGGWSAPQI